MTDKLTTGMTTRRRVLGDAHVDRAEAAKTSFDEPFQTLITEGAWGSVWASDALTHRERSLITLALLAAQGHWDEVAMHIRATANTGATPEDVAAARTAIQEWTEPDAGLTGAPLITLLRTRPLGLRPA